MMPAIEVADISFSYEGTLVLESVSLSVQPGEFIGIFGPNGGGKTTLLKLLMGFLKPTRGTILLFSKPPKEAMQSIGWVPQTFRYDRDFPISVHEVVLGGRLSSLSWHGRFQKKDEEAAMQALEKVGMRHTFNHPFATLSGGQAQRVLIARALASEPSLLLLDEPTASIDIEAEEEIYDLLFRLKGEMTILMVTHDLRGAVQRVDRLFCVQKTVTQMSHAQVCEHFALGLYHPVKEEI